MSWLSPILVTSTGSASAAVHPAFSHNTRTGIRLQPATPSASLGRTDAPDMSVFRSLSAFVTSATNSWSTSTNDIDSSPLAAIHRGRDGYLTLHKKSDDGNWLNL